MYFDVNVYYGNLTLISYAYINPSKVIYVYKCNNKRFLDGHIRAHGSLITALICTRFESKEGSTIEG